jgi:hypothetical protein
MPLLSSETHRRRNRALTVAAWLTLAGLLALVAGVLPATAAPSEACDGAPDVNLPRSVGAFEGEILVDEKVFELPIAEQLSAQTRKVKVKAYPNTEVPENLGATIVEGLVSAEGHLIDEVTAVAEVVSVGKGFDPTIIRVCARLDPRDVADLRPGRYRGAVALAADNYKDAEVPIVVTVRAPRGDGLRMAAAGVVLGLLVKMLTELGSGRKPRRPGAKRALRDYVLQWSFPLAIILGVLTGWLGFVEMYESNATWGVGGDADSLKLLATCFGFQMGSIGGADMTKRLAG